MAYKLDIFETLGAMDRRKFDFYGELDAEQKKGFAPPVALRWLSSIPNGEMAPVYIMLTNDRANINFYDIHDHPELQYKLMASCGLGRTQRHQWIPLSGKKQKNDVVLEFLAKFFPEANVNELNLLLNQFTGDSFEEFVLNSGSSPDRAKEVLKAYGRDVGTDKKAKKSKKTDRNEE